MNLTDNDRTLLLESREEWLTGEREYRARAEAYRAEMHDALEALIKSRTTAFGNVPASQLHDRWYTRLHTHTCDAECLTRIARKNDEAAVAFDELADACRQLAEANTAILSGVDFNEAWELLGDLAQELSTRARNDNDEEND